MQRQWYIWQRDRGWFSWGRGHRKDFPEEMIPDLRLEDKQVSYRQTRRKVHSRTRGTADHTSGLLAPSCQRVPTALPLRGAAVMVTVLYPAFEVGTPQAQSKPQPHHCLLPSPQDSVVLCYVSGSFLVSSLN